MDDISLLLKQFFSAQKNNSKPYFDVDEIISLINHFLEIDDIDNLMIAIEAGHKLHPDDVNFKKVLCSTLVAIEDYGSAIAVIDELGITDDKDIDLIRLECLCELEYYAEAIAYIDKLTINNSPYLEDALIHMGCIINDIEIYREQAYDFLQHALTMFPDSFLLKAELCFNHELRGNTKEAIDICHSLIDEDPYSAEIWYMQGRLYAICTDFGKAIDSFDYSIACISEDDDEELIIEVKLMKAYCLFKNESFEKAITCYSELLCDDESINSQIEPYLAECYISINEYEKAYNILKHLVGSDELEDEVSVYGNLIYSCIETDRKSEAIELFADAIKLFPHSILEYISSLNISKKTQPDIAEKKETIIYPAELVRKYISNSIHNN